MPPAYHDSVPTAGKVFFDSPEGTMVCSATVVQDPAHQGKSNLVWTAGHCVHAGRKGGWYRNIAFVPAYNNSGKTEAELGNAKREEIAPTGSGGVTGLRPRSSGSSRAARPVVRERRTTTP